MRTFNYTHKYSSAVIAISSKSEETAWQELNSIVVDTDSWNTSNFEDEDFDKVTSESPGNSGQYQ